MATIKALIVDDSAVVRQLLTEILGEDRDIEVVGTAPDPHVARDKIKRLDPDVITLDVEMPRMDGLTFLRNVMRLRPMPVVMISSLTQKGADVTLEALELGAVDFVSKPVVGVAQGLAGYADEIRTKVKVAARARVQQHGVRARLKAVPEKLSADAVVEKGRSGARHFRTTDRVVAIGASTGGTEAIKHVVARLPASAPGIVISQHIPEAFSGPFARRVDAASTMTVMEAREAQTILPGHVYISPGDRHLLVTRDGARYKITLSDGPPVNRHRPSVDVMFRTVAQNVGPNAIGVLLTGMGDDGAQGLLEMRESGAMTVIQDEHTSVVWGMPGAAARLGAAEKELSLDKIAGAILNAARSSGQTAA